MNANAATDKKDCTGNPLTVTTVLQDNAELFKLLLDNAKSNDSKLQSLLHPSLACLTIRRGNSEIEWAIDNQWFNFLVQTEY